MNINLTLIGQMITFFIFVGFTMKFIWPSLQKVVNDRQYKINQGIYFAKKAEKDLMDARNKSSDIIYKAQFKANEIIENANLQAIKINNQAIQSANHNANRILKLAKDDTIKQLEIMKKQFKNEIIEISLMIAEKIIRDNVSLKNHDQFLEKIFLDF